MQTTPKWLLVPPVVALLLVLGPLSMQSGAAERQSAPAAPKAEAQADSHPAASPGSRDRLRPSLPATGPDLAQTLSTLVLVLALGVGGVLLVRKLRGGAAPLRGGNSVVALRQTLRLSAKHAVHALEFDDRVLLVGTSEKGVVMLDQGKLPERVADELEVLGRSAAQPGAVVDADDGAVPKNLVIPRPEHAPTRLPKPPQAPSAPVAARSPGLGDFRTLLQKAGRA